MKRRGFIKSTALAAGAMAASGKSLATGWGRPNVLFIIADQWRQPRWFPQNAELPGFNRLKREGMSFSNFFTSAVPCSPSRACFFTGLHINQHGVESNVNFGANPDLDPSIPTLAHRFKQAGYRTPYFGKWHLSSMSKTFKDKLSAYGYDDWVPPDHHGLPYDGLSNDAKYADQSVSWLDRNGKKGSFMLTCSLINPHDICFYRSLDVPPALVPDVFDKLPDNWDDDLKNKPRIQAIYRQGYGKLMHTTPEQPEKVWLQYLDFYYYLQRKVDAQIEKVLAALDRNGLAENTIVIFTSDHGDMCGSHKLQAKGPFVYQENNNVPFVIRWPGRVPAGSETDCLSQSVDVFPTLLDLACVTAETGYLPGKNLAGVCFDPKQAGVHEHILMAMGMRINASQGDGKRGSAISSIIKLAGVDVQGVPFQIRAIHDGRCKYARYFDQGCQEEYELYDLHSDPLEMNNLANDSGYASLKKQMAEKLAEAERKEMAPRSPDWPRIKA